MEKGILGYVEKVKECVRKNMDGFENSDLEKKNDDNNADDFGKMFFGVVFGCLILGIIFMVFMTGSVWIFAKILLWLRSKGYFLLLSS